MISLIVNNFDVLSIFNLKSNCDILGTQFTEVLNYIYVAILVSVPLIVIALGTVDMVRAVTSQDDKGMKEAQNRFVKRLIIGVAIFLVPILLNYFLDLIGLITGTCNIENN